MLESKESEKRENTENSVRTENKENKENKEPKENKEKAKAQGLSHSQLIWDASGLKGYSGIAEHGRALRAALEQKGWHPQIRELGLSLRSAKRVRSSGENGSGRRLVHGLCNYNLPFFKEKNERFILTVHDLIPLSHPREVSLASSLRVTLRLPRALALADRVIAVSKWTADALKERFKGVEGKLVHIPNGWGAAPRAKNGPYETPTRSDAKIFRLLTISRYESYKALDDLGAVAEILGQSLRARGFELRWDVVTDARGMKLLARSSQLSQSSQGLYLHSSLSEEALQTLWQSCDLYVQPSRLEGYCLPAAKSLGLAIPLVYCQGSAIDELAAPFEGPGQNFALGLRPWLGPLPWAEACERMLFAQRESTLSAKGLVSWDEVARRVAEIYTELSD